MGAWPRQRPLACCNPCSLAGRSCGGATTTALARHCARRDRDSRPLGGESPRLIGAESSVVALSWRYRGSIVAPCALVVTLPPSPRGCPQPWWVPSRHLKTIATNETCLIYTN